ncbi:fungal-specific transcription factor domain-containing protein [Dactylonectria macrodidyma]|uniref:Fungal-specific transcription factor domain-containing protein n=1 Tax=Dactylonectria macrodidyma TaxID=307937 RepID=A0A9P9IQU7_9HYPO|nr:fungal-specific transcription factor domain-containing protein [Dactylonectria macrodidyma]
MPSDVRDRDADSDGDGDGNGNEQCASSPHDAPVAMQQNGTNDGDKNDRGKRGQPRVVDATKGVSERPTKKARRGKYISRACVSCQQRKIKCEGGDPCAQCVTKKRFCVPTWRGGRPPTRQDLETDETGATKDSTASNDSSVNRDVLARLAALESQLRLMRSSSVVHRSQEHSQSRMPVDDQSPYSSAELQDAQETDGQTFAGELSMTPAVEGEDDNVDRANTPGILPEYPSPGSSLHPTTRRVRGWLENILRQHRVDTDEQQWRQDLQAYMEEIHPAYTFLHPPTVWEIFNEMWENSSVWPTTETAEHPHKRQRQRNAVALVFLCLAVGRCCNLPRIPDVSGVYSSGWGLYNVAMSLLQGAAEASSATAKSLLVLQVLIVRVLYLFRLDANQQAAHVMGLTVSIAHTIGMHRQSALDRMPAFHNQLYCRTWWVIYMLDRRIAIESGKPYLIQDSNVDTALPLDLSDEWMTRFTARKERIADLEQEIAIELDRDSSPSPIPYTIAMVRYARVAGKAWQILYGVKTSGTSMSATVQHLDTLLAELLDTVPKNLRYGPDSEARFRTSLRWQVKQTLLHFISCTYLRLLIKRPFLLHSRAVHRTEDDVCEEATACASLATGILSTYQNLKDHGLKHSFALSHYVTSCTMVMLGLVSRMPGFKRRYGDLVLASTQSLNMYCRRNWVSGKMIRLVSRLSQIVQRNLVMNPSDSHARQSPARLRRDLGVGDQLTPHTEDRDPLQILEGTGTSAVGSNELKRMSIDAGGGARKDQWQNGFSYNGDATATPIPVQPRNPKRAEHLGTSWKTGPSDGKQVDWAMSDLNFEAIVGSAEGFDFNGAEFSMLSDDTSLVNDRAGSSVAEGNFGDAGLSLLGLDGVAGLDLELDVDLSTMNIWGTSPMMDFDVVKWDEPLI